MLHKFKFKTQVLIYFFIIILFILTAVMQLLFFILKNSYRDMERSVLDTQARQIAMNIDYKIDYYTTYAEMLTGNKNLIFAAENDDFKQVEQVLGYETAKFMSLNKGRISKIQIYRNGIFTSKYYDIQRIFGQFIPGKPAYTGNAYWTGTYLNERNEKVFSFFTRLYQGNGDRTYLIEMCFYETELYSLINKTNSNYSIDILNNGVMLSTSDRKGFVQSLYEHKAAYTGIAAPQRKLSADNYQIASKSNTGWDVLITFNNNYLDQNFTRLYMGLVPVVLAVLAIASLFAALISSQLNRRFSILHKKIDSISQWDFTKDIRMGGNDEFKVLSDALDNTKQRIVGLIGEINDANDKKRSAEISALRAQINSHFLLTRCPASSGFPKTATSAPWPRPWTNWPRSCATTSRWARTRCP